MKRITLFLLAVLTAHAGQTLTLTNTAGQAKDFYVVGCTQKAVICKMAAADKQTFEIPMDQLAPGSVPEALQRLAAKASDVSSLLVTGSGPDSRQERPYAGPDKAFGPEARMQSYARSGASFGSSRYNDNFKNEQQITFQIKGKIEYINSQGGCVVSGVLTDYNNDKTQRVRYAPGDARRLDKKTETTGKFTVYGISGTPGDSVDAVVYSTKFITNFILAGKAKDAVAACDNVMIPMEDSATPPAP